MKILQVNCVYKTGSTGKIVYDIHTELQRRGYESVVCYGRGINYKEDNVYKVCGEFESHVYQFITRCNGLIFSSCNKSTYKLTKLITIQKPDIVHIHCINGFFVNIYKFILWLKIRGIKVVLTLHAEFMYTANCGISFECDKWKNGCGDCPNYKLEIKSLFDRTNVSWRRMMHAFENFVNLRVVSVSPWLMVRAQESPILSSFQHSTILNGIDTGVFHPYEYSNEKIDRITPHKKLVFHVTPYFTLDETNLKGGYYVWELAKRLPDIQFVIAGTYDNTIDPLSNITFLGRIDNQYELAEWYSRADVTLITSKRETFSMVVAESLCCGTPVVGFKAGGPELIAIDEYCRFIDYADVDQLEYSLRSFIHVDFNRSLIATKAKVKYDKSRMTDEYITVYKSLMG